MFGGVWILASSSGHFALSELADEAWNQARGFVRELTRDVISHPKPQRTTGSEAEGILRLGKILSEKSSVPRKEGLIREGGVKRGFTVFFVLFIDIVLYPLRKTQKSTSSTRWKRLKRC